MVLGVIELGDLSRGWGGAYASLFCFSRESTVRGVNSLDCAFPPLAIPFFGNTSHSWLMTTKTPRTTERFPLSSKNAQHTPPTKSPHSDRMASLGNDEQGSRARAVPEEQGRADLSTSIDNQSLGV